jgi:thiol:disulfide interchange protein DsbD
MVGAAGKLAGEWALQQNCEKPDKLSGVVVSRSPLIGDAKSVYLSSFPVLSGRPAGANIPQTANPSAAEPNTSASQTPPAGAVNQSTADQVMANNFQPANANIVSSSGGSAPPAEPPFLPFVLAAALLGGIILNLMPCVLPVLSLKVFSLIRHAGEDPKAAWKQGAAFTAGVLVSFWVLAGLLIAFNSAGSHLGWGFQMQSPGFVLALILLFFLLGLNLFGVFEIGTSLVGLDAKAAANADRAHLGGLASSFGNGALATLAATPCTAPFMGSALGFAAQQPAYIALLVFTFLALGMAAPYLLLTIFPGALRFVPKPGEWMVSLKQFMGFLLVATAAWLTPIFGRLAGHGWLGWLLIALVFVGMAAWIYGRWGLVRTLIFIPVAGLLLYEPQPMPDTWQVWSPQVVQQNLNAGKPVFVDFTADWCLSCKVNERLALGTDAVKNAFADKGVALLRGDWTNSDPAISAELQKYNRAGVPLYLLYSPKAKDAPQVLPEVLTPGIVLDALNKL